MITNVKIIKQDKGIEDFQRDIEIQFISVKDSLKLLADTTTAQMKTIIDTNRKRDKRFWGSKWHLTDAIKTYTLPNGYGVGDIDILDIVAPYWYLINYGGVPSYSGKTHFIPGYFQGSNFVYNPMQNTGIRLPSGIKGKISAMNYIEKTKAFVNSIWRIHFSGWNNKIRIYANK